MDGPHPVAWERQRDDDSHSPCPKYSPPQNTGGSDIGWQLAIHRAIGRVPRLHVPLDIEADRRPGRWLSITGAGVASQRNISRRRHLFLTPPPPSSSLPLAVAVMVVPRTHPHTLLLYRGFPSRPPPGRPGSYPSSVSAFPAFQFWPCLERTSRLTKAACRPSPARSSVVVPSRPITSPNSIRNLTHRLDPPTIPEPNARSFSALRVIHRVEPVVSAAALQQQHHAPRTQSSRPALGLSALHTPRPPCHPL